MNVADKLKHVAENMQKVYDAGKAAGGYTEGYEAGQRFEHDRFWDVFQQNGNRTNYALVQGSVASGHFYHGYWSMNNFYPKYDITPEGTAANVFYYWSKANHPDVTDWDLSKRLQDCGVVFDATRMTDAGSVFNRTDFTHLPYCDFSNCVDTHTVGPFEYCEKLNTIDGIKMSEKTYINRWFVRCGELVDCPFDGVIGSNGLNVSWSAKLSHDTLMTIIYCLKDYSGSGTTHTVTLGATNLAKLTSAEKSIATQKGWTLA